MCAVDVGQAGQGGILPEATCVASSNSTEPPIPGIPRGFSVPTQFAENWLLSDRNLPNGLSRDGLLHFADFNQVSSTPFADDFY